MAVWNLKSWTGRSNSLMLLPGLKGCNPAAVMILFVFLVHFQAGKLITQLYSFLTIWITWIACRKTCTVYNHIYMHTRIPVLFWISSAVTWTYCIRKNYFHLALSWHSIPISGLFSPPKIPGRLKAGASSAVLTRKKKFPPDHCRTSGLSSIGFGWRSECEGMVVRKFWFHCPIRKASCWQPWQVISWYLSLAGCQVDSTPHPSPRLCGKISGHENSKSPWK